MRCDRQGRDFVDYEMSNRRQGWSGLTRDELLITMTILAGYMLRKKLSIVQIRHAMRYGSTSYSRLPPT